MVICPIARTVHCTGCPLVKFCPAKTILGDFGKEKESAGEAADKEKKSSERSPDDSSSN